MSINGPVGVDQKDVRLWAMACHFAAFSGLLGNGIGFLIGPLILWLVKREDHPFIDDHGKEAVNFQITMMIAIIVSAMLLFVVIGIFILPLLGIFNVVCVTIAGVKAANGEWFRYPCTIRFLK
ncbi:MAG: DUF4870 domain-containing protein [Planctomycetota bacterium]|jgi:uncharacterized Tic20 family protein